MQSFSTAGDHTSFPRVGMLAAKYLPYPGTAFLLLGWPGLNGSNRPSRQAWLQVSLAILSWLVSCLVSGGAESRAGSQSHREKESGISDSLGLTRFPSH